MRRFSLGRALRLAAFLPLILNLGVASPEAAAEDEALSSWLVKADDATMKQIAARFEIEHRRGDRFEVVVPVSQRAALLALAPDAELVEVDMAAAIRELEDTNPAYAAYRSFAEVETLLKRLEAEHPDIAKLEQYGVSERGKPLYALKLSDNVLTDEQEPELMLTSATHGDEIITTETLLTMIEELVAGHGTDARLTAMIDDHELFFVPMLNADGFAARSRYAGGVDPNRDYPWPDEPTRSPTACIQHIMDFFHAHHFAGSIDFHAYGQLIMYPWAYTYDPIDPDDAAAMQTLGDSMAEDNDYEVGPISRVIYVAQGSSADYYYWKTRSLSYGIELTTSKAPPTSSIPHVVDEAREMTWRFIENF